MELWQQFTAYASANTGVLLIAAMGAALIAVVLSLVALRRITTLIRPLNRIPRDPSDPRAILPAVLMKMEETEAGLAELASHFEAHAGENRSHVKYVGLERFNAFEDIAGQQSYSLCLLNEERDGVLLTYLTGKNSARSYAVGIESGRAPRKLSDEESRALERALNRESAPQPEGVTVAPR